MKPTKKSFLVLLLFVQLVKAQDNKQNSFSLQQAIEYAYKNSPMFLNAELDYQSANARRKEIAGLGLPQINGSIDVKNYLEIPTSLLPAEIFGGAPGSFLPVRFGTKYNATAGISASQLIFSSDYIFGLQASKAYMDLATTNVFKTKNELASGITKAYLGYVITKEKQKMLEENVKRTKTLYETTKALNQQGFAELLDVQRSEVEFNNAAVERDKNIRGLTTIEALLKMQMGFAISDAIVISDTLNLDNSEAQELAMKADYSKRPDFMALQGAQKLLDLDVKRWQYGYLPTLAAYGAYQYNAQRNTFNLLQFDKNDVSKQWFKIALIGVQLNVNIFDGLQRNYKIQQAKIAALQNQNTLKMLAFNADAEILTSSVNYSSAYQSLQNQKKTLTTAQGVYDSAVKKYEAGVGSSLEIVFAQSQLTASQLSYFAALYDLTIAKTDYLKATGTLVK